jgi:hypothetical protein
MNDLIENKILLISLIDFFYENQDLKDFWEVVEEFKKIRGKK